MSRRKRHRETKTELRDTPKLIFLHTIVIFDLFLYKKSHFAYLPSKSKEVKNKVHRLSLIDSSPINTEGFRELLLPGFLADDEFIEVYTGQVSYTCDKSLVI